MCNLIQIGKFILSHCDLIGVVAVDAVATTTNAFTVFFNFDRNFDASLGDEKFDEKLNQIMLEF